MTAQASAAENCRQYTQRSQLDACERRNSDARIGKYFCFVSNTAGIQYNETNGVVSEQPLVGRFNPAPPKFFVTIERNPFSCQNGSTDNQDGACSFEPRYLLKSDGKGVLGTLQSRDARAFIEDFGHSVFRLTDNNAFVKFETFSDNQGFVSDGKCERIGD
jgi:hypothetical protein